jgi:hypothetical protein
MDDHRSSGFHTGSLSLMLKYALKVMRFGRIRAYNIQSPALSFVANRLETNMKYLRAEKYFRDIKASGL